MTSRGTRKGGTHRMDGAIAALTPLGFSKKLIRDTIRELLQVYGDNDAGWYFVEENYYKLAIDKIIEDQESNKEEQMEMALGDECHRGVVKNIFGRHNKKMTSGTSLSQSATQSQPSPLLPTPAASSPQFYSPDPRFPS
ncbi:hypothetical protein M5K25_025980 [Dendrobium thyrsiflorum]|uniref:WIYLD domain-containing protein n=1 Tax=Dendrobium thyrsiflorum TaxID=117978 RepID=A0ABD0TW36_DENTH